MNDDRDPHLEEIAERLDRLRQVPDDVLADLVMRDGLCPWFVRPGDLEQWDDAPPTDRELAARLCAGCPVIDECLEVDLRIEGRHTTGVWGALPEDDRHELLRLRQQRRADEQQNGGPQP